MASGKPGGASVRISAELRDAIQALLAARRPEAALTLQDVRLALQRDDSLWEQEGELLHPQDRTALLIEIDELIERHGEHAAAPGFLAR
jgi:hypothetical protein